MTKPNKTKSPKAAVKEQPKPPTKHAITLKLLSREQGATLADLMEATGWKSHSVRGHLSNMRRKKKLTIEAFLHSDGKRGYRLIQGEEAT